MAYKRKRMSKRGSRKLFKKTARRIHKKNAPRRMVRRGGMRC